MDEYKRRNTNEQTFLKSSLLDKFKWWAQRSVEDGVTLGAAIKLPVDVMVKAIKKC